MTDDATSSPVTAAEHVLRAVSTSDLRRTGSVKWQAVAPRHGEDRISVIRHAVTGSNTAKMYGTEVKRDFAGFARARVETILDRNADVSDSPEVFVGHADIVHGFARPPAPDAVRRGEPAEPDSDYMAALGHYAQLARAFCLFRDRADQPDVWRGAELSAPCADEPADADCVHQAPPSVSDDLGSDDSEPASNDEY